MCCSGVPYPPEGICDDECGLASDRALKHGLEPVDAAAVLEQLMDLEVTRWRYDASPEVQHMGPMAQDFQARFGLGASDRHIAPVDANGVLMVAVQQLARRVAELEREHAAEQERTQQLTSDVARLRRRLWPATE
jgi:hypothetical protein